MATEKVGVYRKWHGPVPVDEAGNPLPKREWPDKRPFSWSARWFGSDGKRYSKSFSTRKEAERFAEAKQQDVRQGKGDPPVRMTLREFYWEHKKLMQGKVAHTTLHMQLATLALLAESVGWDRDVKRLTPRDIEQFSATRATTGNEAITVNKEVKTLKRLFNLAISRGYLATGSNPAVGVPMAKGWARSASRIARPSSFTCSLGKRRTCSGARCSWSSTRPACGSGKRCT